ncbi:DegV family protein [Desulforamulus aquiferis]|uniref:DegV family protein n=1 Tax=Desulforamulus aquiferis TaxID=1397668 RepID=A0AAW7ZDY7_9FIRM|nr:DegV family protein [Desulforamulus aquiferis]MDO7787266.1 DegV family protein [Desulforamulus aquiferis]
MADKVAIVTDSTCDLEIEILREYGIRVLPLKVIYEHEEFLDRVEITPQQVYDRMPGEIPCTSLPSPAHIWEMFNGLRQEGYTHILSMHISSGLSGTYNAVLTTAREFNDIVIEVLDSRALSLGLGIPVLEAAKTYKETLSFEATLNKAKESIGSMEVYFVLSTLEYLKKGGRIGYVAGTIGEIMQIKPIISINEEGKYFTFERVRGRKKSLQRLVQIAVDKIGQNKADVAVMHGGAVGEAKEIFEKINNLANIEDKFIGQVGPVIGVHTGPGLIGLCIRKL